MATPRKRWWKVADSTAFEAWPNDVAATFLRLGGYLNTRWARDGKSSEERGRVVVSSAVLQQLTGCASLARARRVLHELATHVTLTIDEQGTNTLIWWPKYAKEQESESEARARLATDDSRAVPSPTPTPTPTPTPIQSEEERAPSAPSAARTPRATRPKAKSPRAKTLCPDALTDDEWLRVTEWAVEQGIDPSTLNREWEKHRTHWQREAKLGARWDSSFQNWLLKACEFAERDRARDARIDEGRGVTLERRNREAALEAFRRIEGSDDDGPPLFALTGGRS